LRPQGGACLREHEGVTAVRPERALLVFAAAVFAFHHLPTLLGDAGEWIDLVTPFAVIGAAGATLITLGAPSTALAVALLAGLLYVDGHGIHLAANSIAAEPLTGEAARVADFWDERFSHVEWHVGWIGLLASFCLAERALMRDRALRLERRARVATALLLGFTLFTNTVEGGTWWLELAAAALFAGWAVRDRRQLLVTCAAALALAAALIGVWAVWQGGVPQFSETGLI
jgi:hypothetical protein